MIRLILAAALSQTPPPVSPAPPLAPVPVVSADSSAQAVTPAVLSEEQKKAQMAAERQERVGCVVKTGTRIKRKDRNNCAPGSSISKEDIERAGGVFVMPGNAGRPPGAGG